MRELSARLFIGFLYLLPRHLLTKLVYRIARLRSVGVKNFLIRQFVKAYDVNIDEIDAVTPDDFETFNDFFTRRLAAGERPIDRAADSIVSPVDGTISAAGGIEKNAIFQAKGMRYTLEELLATDLQEASGYRNGRFATIYLAPCNYHRVHAPLNGRLRVTHYIPGDLFSVNSQTVAGIDGLFARNERLVCHFESDDGPWALIFVGALNVGSISTPWTGEIRPEKRGVVQSCALDSSETALAVSKGDLLGWFNMGSTVILLLPDGRANWSSQVLPGQTLRMGEAIGRMTSSDD